jgi:hypothetical protein
MIYDYPIVENYESFKISNTYDSLNTYDLRLINEMASQDILNAHSVKEKILLDNVIIEEPAFSVLDEHYDFIHRNSSKTLFKEKWNYRPAHASLEIYGSPFYSYLLLFANNFPCNKYFKKSLLKEYLIVPNRIVIEMIRSIVENKKLNFNYESIDYSEKSSLVDIRIQSKL